MQILRVLPDCVYGRIWVSLCLTITIELHQLVANGYTFVLVHSGYYTKIPMAKVADKKMDIYFSQLWRLGV